MYKARVDSVNGIKVRAGGKLLTCIGNRPVKVGDTIWTDGRCVYGNDEETQIPLVITHKVKDEFGIPVLITENQNDWNSDSLSHEKNIWHCFTFRNDTLFPIDFNKKHLVEFFINGYNKEFYTSEHSFILGAGTLASNIDKQGNIFTIELARNSYEKYSYLSWYSGHRINVNSGHKIYIKKNDKILETININQLLQENADLSAELNSHNCYIELNPPSVDWAYESNWAFIVTSSALSKSVGDFIEDCFNSEELGPQYIYDENFLEVWATSYPEYNYLDKVGYSGTSYYFDSFGTSKKIFSWQNIFSYSEIPNFSRTRLTGINKIEENFNPSISIKFPIQDQYFFTVDNFKSVPSFMASTPFIARHNFFNPQGKLLFQDDFLLGTYFTIHKNLLGVYSKKLIGDLYSVEFPLNLNFDFKDYDFIRNGLYTFQNRKLTKIADGNIKNQRLRPVKHYKNWWQLIQSIN